MPQDMLNFRYRPEAEVDQRPLLSGLIDARHRRVVAALPPHSCQNARLDARLCGNVEATNAMPTWDWRRPSERGGWYSRIWLESSNYS